MSFKVGDRVVIVKAAPLDGAWLGATATVASRLHPMVCGGGDDHRHGACWCATGITHGHDLVDIPGVNPRPGGQIAYPPEWLAPLTDDGALKGEWDDLTRNLCRVKEKVET